ncbi:cytochrome P450 [Apiospora arundinis]
MREVSKNQHAHMWTEAIEARFERGKPWGREEFDRLLGKYEIGTPQFISLLDLACTGVLEGYLGAFIESYTKTNTRSNDFSQYGLALYRQHNQAVREAASRRGRKLLEYKPGMGWAPLCEFLDLPMPTADIPYPQVDDWLEYKQEKTAEKAAHAWEQ